MSLFVETRLSYRDAVRRLYFSLHTVYHLSSTVCKLSHH